MQQGNEEKRNVGVSKQKEKGPFIRACVSSYVPHMRPAAAGRQKKDNPPLPSRVLPANLLARYPGLSSRSRLGLRGLNDMCEEGVLGVCRGGPVGEKCRGLRCGIVLITHPPLVAGLEWLSA